MKYLLALDQGTTSSRALVFDTDGRIVAAALREFAQSYPRPGWIEHDPALIWASQRAAAEQALRDAGLRTADVIAAGIANQRETTVIWERESGRAIAPAIVWQDRRTASLCAELRAQGMETRVRAKTGLTLDPYFSATKIAWLLNHVDGARARAERGELAFGTVDSWLLWNLTAGQEHATDVTNAARTLLFNIHTLKWDAELLELFDIPHALLPEVRPSAARFGTASLAEGEIAITGVAGDQHAALIGQACLEPGQTKNTYGTGAFVVANTGQEVIASDKLLATPAWRLPDAKPAYALEGSIFVAGAAVQWLRDGLGLIATAEESEALAAQVADSGGVSFVPALAGLGAPFWDTQARGTILGLTRGTTAAHLARATLEAIAFRTRDVIEAMSEATGKPFGELRVDGGAARNNLLMQIQADLLGVPVVRPQITETTALGAAMLAGIGAGVMTLADIARTWHEERRFEPALDANERDRRYGEWRRACERARDWIQE
ncbi:MAG: glycerol kinase GlpK [Gammaproteobacteria bacterium]